MNLDVDATYRDGAIYPVMPLNLPDNTRVRVRVLTHVAGPPKTLEEVIALRPKSPSFTAEELDALIEKFNISAPSLPADFSRADIYSDHD
jgi:hypothetical protein